MLSEVFFQLMSRSRSMEAIADGGPVDDDQNHNPNQPTLFTRRQIPAPEPAKRPERPKTALANMRTPGNF